MAFSLILGAILGAVSVIFVLQNITPIQVTFLTWHIDGSLALILFLALVCGMLITVLMLVPGFIRDEIRYSSLKKRNKELEEGIAAMQRGTSAPAPDTVTVTETSTTLS